MLKETALIYLIGKHVESVDLIHDNIVLFNRRIWENTWKTVASLVTEIWSEDLRIRGRNATTNIVCEAEYSFSRRQMGQHCVQLM